MDAHRFHTSSQKQEAHQGKYDRAENVDVEEESLRRRLIVLAFQVLVSVDGGSAVEKSVVGVVSAALLLVLLRVAQTLFIPRPARKLFYSAWK